MNQVKNETGITLVALIITIVILLILAAVTIAAIRNENIIMYTNNAVLEYNETKSNEQNTLEKVEDFLNKHLGECKHTSIETRFVKNSIVYHKVEEYCKDCGLVTKSTLEKHGGWTIEDPIRCLKCEELYYWNFS